MSSNEDENDDLQNKKRRVQRACDACRRKKIRCDGVQMPGNRCSNCIAYNFDCSYNEAAKKRGPPKGYVESLETRVEKMDELLHRLMPEADFTRELGSRFSKDAWTIESKNRHIPDIMRTVSAGNMKNGGPSQLIPKGAFNPAEEKLLEDEFQHLTLVDNLHMALLPEGGDGYRFFGKSSGAQLIRTALDMKNTFQGVDCEVPTLPTPNRPEFWGGVPQWENNNNLLEGIYPVFSFPPDDLLQDLIELYFARLNIFMPLLHRPTFNRDIANGLHLKNDMFAALLLLVCACASRYSDDERVLLDGETSKQSSGWKWFDQVQVIRKSILSPPGLYDLQVFVLFTEFLSGSSAPQASWTMVGVGLRLAQDVGAHRKKKNHTTNTVESELWKRAFWILVAMDRVHSGGLGRPCAIHDEDIDLDFPAECDDEYWETADPEQAFKQPPGKPSYVTFFNTYLRLNQLLSFCLRTIYSLNKSKILLGFVGQQWEQHIVAELDSALNRWVDSIPDHLRWDPNRGNMLHFNQSAHIYISYYHLQILIHRPFIPTPKNPSPLSFPSLAICTNAARSCSHVVDIHGKRTNGLVIPSVGMPAFTAGIVLLFNIWGGQRSGLSIDPGKEMDDVHKVMKLLRNMESRWHIAGRLWDILYELASVGDLPLPKHSPPPSNKRDRDSDSPQTSASVTIDSPAGTPPPPAAADKPRTIVGTRRVVSRQDMTTAPSRRQSSATSTGMSEMAPIIPPKLASPPMSLPPPPTPTQQSHSHSQPISPPPPPPMQQQSFGLPMYSNELGRIPLHGQVNFSSHAHEHSWYGGGDGMEQPQHSHLPLPPTPQDFAYMNQAHQHQPQQQQQQQAYYGLSPVNGYAGEIPTYQFPAHAGGGMMDTTPPQPNMAPMDDTIAMWSHAPSGFELDDWGTYLTNVSEMTQHTVNGEHAHAHHVMR